MSAGVEGFELTHGSMMTICPAGVSILNVAWPNHISLIPCRSMHAPRNQRFYAAGAGPETGALWGGPKPNSRRIAKAPGVAQAVPDHELIGDFEADVVCLERFDAARRLIQERNPLECLRASAQQEPIKIVQGQPGIENVFDQQYTAPFDRFV